MKKYYGIIGNGETCALISPYGSIDWLCLPKFDGNLVLTKAIDARFGKSLYFTVKYNSQDMMIEPQKQKYVENTNVLETFIDCNKIEIKITDFMHWKGISENISDKRIIFRKVLLKNKVKEKCRIKFNINTEGNEIIKNNSLICINKSYAGFVIRNEDIIMKPYDEKQIDIMIVYGKNKKEISSLIRQIEKININTELSNAVKFWNNWIERGKDIVFENNNYENMFYRSLLTCKLLTYHKGSILAAPTASFPATPFGGENWDYRFCWIRDSCIVSEAFLKTGHYEEVSDFLDFIFNIQDKDGHWSPIYTAEGKKLKKETIINLYDKKIHIGNGARNQLQLDSEGSILRLIYFYYIFTHDKEMLEKKWNKIKKSADWICKNYKKKENGLWELREKEHKKKSQWTYGKVMCYAGLESAVKIADILGHDGNKWESKKNIIKNEILENSWSDQRKSFLQTYDKDSQIDISVLSVEESGLLSPLNSKIKNTVKLIEKKLIVNGFGVKRFEDAVLPFYLPTLWLALHYIRVSEIEKARKLIDGCINSSTNLYLLAEHFDPIKSEQHGNFPQAFNHAIFVEALLAYRERENNIKFLELLNMHFKVFADFIDKIAPKKELYLNE